jgi:hypothetical protein
LRFSRASFLRFLSFRQRRFDIEPRPIRPDRSSVLSWEPLGFVEQANQYAVIDQVIANRTGTG